MIVGTSSTLQAVGTEKEAMHKTINHLMQLQELTVARAQQEASMPGARLTELDQSIHVLLEELPSDVRVQFSRIQKKDLLAIIPISNGVCSACGMSLPVSLVNDVRAAERLYQCPNCARLLCYPVASFRREGRRARRGDPPKVGIARFSSPELMIPKLSSDTRDDVLAELCTKMEAEGFVEDASKLVDAAMQREAIISTAVDHGIAFPHVRGVEGGGLSLVLGVKKKGLKFGAPGRKLTRIVFFMVIPTAASAFYLKLLAGLTQTFQKEEAREKLLEADSPDKLWKALVKLTKTTVL